MPAPQQGLYRLKQGELSTVVAVGPPSPREFEETLASAEVLGKLVPDIETAPVTQRLAAE